MADLSALLDALPLPTLAVDADERVIAANPAALSLLGPGAVWRALALSLRAPEVLAGVGAVLAGETVRDKRLVLARDGVETTFAVTLRGVGEGEGRRVILTFRDTTAEEQAEAMRRDFVANVSHELRTPLTALMGFIETLQGPAKDDAAARARFLSIMAREAGRMNRLVRDLLHLSRVEAEERVRPTDRVDLAALLRGVAGTLRTVAEGRGAEIALDLPETAEVPGDHDQLVQVFSNLIENGLKYGAEGQVLRVGLTREDTPRGPALRVEVADRGEGIDPIHLPRLTERFYRVDSHRSREQGGTGLGLAIVKHIVQRHRGALRIESVKGEGSRFSVVLPRG